MTEPITPTTPTGPSRDDIVAAAASVVKLPENFRPFIQGDTIEAALQSARELGAAIAAHGAPSAPEPTPAAAEPEQTPTPSRPAPEHAESVSPAIPREQPGGMTIDAIRRLAKQDARKFNAMVDAGEIDMARIMGGK
jgi:hypothetical protein